MGRPQQEVILTQEQVTKKIKDGNPKHYQKFGIFNYEILQEAREVITSIDGVEEVRVQAEAGEVLV